MVFPPNHPGANSSILGSTKSTPKKPEGKHAQPFLLNQKKAGLV